MKSEALDKIQNDPVSSQIYDGLLTAMKPVRTHTVEPKAASVDFVHKTIFMNVMPRVNGLKINLITDEPIEDQRIAKQTQISDNRYHNELMLVSAPEIDNSFMEWVWQAYHTTNK